MHKFGVGFLGDSGPKAPIVLGTKSLSLSVNISVKIVRARVLLVIITLLAELYHVVETLDVDPDGQGNIVLAHGGQEGREVDQPVDPLVDDDLLQTLEVQDVSEHEGSLGQLLVGRLDDVREDDALLAV